MTPREIFAALFDARGPAKEPNGAWQFVGDFSCFDQERFQIMAALLQSSRFWVAASRTEAQETSLVELSQVVQRLLHVGEVRVADIGLTQFLQVNPIGVARHWSRND